jgi:transposase
VDAGSGRKIGGGRRPLTPSRLDRRGRFQAGCWEPAHGPFSVASSTRIRFLHSCPWLLRAAATFPVIQREARQVLAKTQDNEEIIERVAACDIGKAELVCCVRVPDEDHRGRRLQEVEAYPTMTRALLGMAGRLACLGVTRVVMEATSDYWKPMFYLLEAAGFETWLAGAKDVRHLSGRPKTGKLDCIWLCKVAERQMIRPSFVPPPVRKLRDLTRYRADLVAARTAEKNRAEKLLEDAQIKLSVVVSDIFGASGRDMLAALVAGERNPKVLAQLARHTMRKKITVLEEAFTGYFTDHHAFLLGRMLARVDAIAGDIAALDARIEQEIAPFAAGIGRHQARLGGQRYYRQVGHFDDRCADRRRAPRQRAGRPGDRPDAHSREAGRPVAGAGRPVHRASRAAVPAAPRPHRRLRRRGRRPRRADRGQGRPLAARTPGFAAARPAGPSFRVSWGCPGLCSNVKKNLGPGHGGKPSPRLYGGRRRRYTPISRCPGCLNGILTAWR